MKKLSQSIVLLLLFTLSFASTAETVYQAPETFVAESFTNAEPMQHVLWLDKALQRTAKSILGHKYAGLRVRYWRLGERSAWILDEIGKEQPITFGVLVDDDKIESIEVLVYRESRGAEIRHNFFTRQFLGAGLAPSAELDVRVNNITGATMSVRAMTDIAQLALYFHSASNAQLASAVE